MDKAKKGSWGLKAVKWAGIGLFIRLMLMPFTMHGQDLQFIYYFPMMFVTQGVWDPYKFLSLHMPGCISYYGPVIFLIMAAVNFVYLNILKIAYLAKMLVVSATMFCGNMVTADYVYAFGRTELFRCLFLMKLPYLLFDCLIVVLLLKIDWDSRENRLKSFVFWMFNIVLLHSSYACGQFEVIAAFFVIAALYAALKKRPYLCLVLLSLGGATKMFPYILILPASFLLGENWKKRSLLLLAAGLTSLVLYLPFYLSSGVTVFSFFGLGRYYDGTAKWVLNAAFLIFYCVILAHAVRDSRRDNPQKHLIFYFLATAFMVFAAVPISFRYFVFITPLLAMVMPRHKRFAVFVILSVLLLAFLRLPTRDVQFGLLSPLDPAYFNSLPAFQEIIGRFININTLYKICARVMMSAFFACALWVWRIKTANARDLI